MNFAAISVSQTKLKNLNYPSGFPSSQGFSKEDEKRPFQVRTKGFS
ncbi:hypothetical protein PF008_g23649 [Phytophthora fragariae]|uniref:Uncharacterized protein n=1 Tax=Phytophthora fragariae TaxID=53985 RepID=A0A6G0QQ56_9STRA|nr:hypothetical protein PF008_g23649 [Phytophthora fragariae]